MLALGFGLVTILNLFIFLAEHWIFVKDYFMRFTTRPEFSAWNILLDTPEDNYYHFGFGKCLLLVKMIIAILSCM